VRRSRSTRACRTGPADITRPRAIHGDVIMEAGPGGRARSGAQRIAEFQHTRTTEPSAHDRARLPCTLTWRHRWSPALVLARPEAPSRKVRKLSSCRLRRSLPLMLLSAGSGPRKCPQPASIRTFHRWWRVRRFGWPGVTPRSGARGIGIGSGLRTRCSHDSARACWRSEFLLHRRGGSPVRFRRRTPPARETPAQARGWPHQLVIEASFEVTSAG
jgi:hypothetical protein